MELDNAIGLKESTTARNEKDYSPESLNASPFRLPVNVLRPLASNDSVENLKQLAIPDFHLAIIRHRISPHGKHYSLPLHFMTAFTHSTSNGGLKDKIRVAGSVFVSTLHSLLESPALSVDQKAKITDAVLTEYTEQANDYDVSVISMPKRNYQDNSLEIKPENSLTHTLMLRACKNPIYYREQGNSGLYFLSHKGELNQAKRNLLINDQTFFDQIAGIGSVWSENFQRESPKSPSTYLAKRQKEEVVDLLAQFYS